MTPSLRREEGVIAMVVAMLFGFGVILALGALTVDVGNINADRRQLQNGADAVALSVAQQCAKAGTCSPADPDLPKLANLNAATSMNRASEIRRVDGQAAICGNVASLAACPTSSAPDTKNLQECPAATLPSGAKFVRVYTETKNASSGKNLLPYSFGAAIAGAGSGANQQTCSSAAWGPPVPGGASVPFGISACEWFKSTSNGDPSKYAALPSSTTYPQYSPFPDSFEQALPLNEPLLPVTDPCYTWRGHDFAGGFGWLDRTDAPGCQANIDPLTGWVGVVTGAGGGSAGKCSTVIEGYVGQVVEVPIFDCMSLTRNFCDNTNNGKKSNYHILSTAAFFVTAYDLADVKASIDKAHPTAAAQTACIAKGGTGSKCLYGWFVKKTSSGAVGGTGTEDFGNDVIQLVG